MRERVHVNRTMKDLVADLRKTKSLNIITLQQTKKSSFHHGKTKTSSVEIMSCLVEF